MYPTPCHPPAQSGQEAKTLISSLPGNYSRCSVGLRKVIKNEALVLTVRLPVTTGNMCPKQKEGWLVAESQ